jgi:hypothetical protein
MHAAAAQKYEALAVQYLKPIAVQHAQVANNPLPVAGVSTRR